MSTNHSQPGNPTEGTESLREDSAYLKPALDYIDNWLEHQTVLDQSTPGYQVAISHNGKIIYSRGFGYACLEQKEKMSPQHIFRIASHSKTFTSVAIMQLVESGKLSLFDKATEYLGFLKENPNKSVQEVTLHELLQHASGFSRDGNDGSYWSLEKDFPSKEDLKAFFRKTDLKVENNSCFKYSNLGFGLLGMVVEEVSGESYSDYVKKNILEPTGLDKTAPDYEPDLGQFVTNYSSLTPWGEIVPIGPDTKTGSLLSATGFCSNAEEICKFYSAVLPKSGVLLPDSLKKEAFRKQREIPGREAWAGYGLGFNISKIGDHLLRGHNGGMPGSMTSSSFCPETRMVVSVLSNSQSSDATPIQRAIWKIMDKFKHEYDPTSPHLYYTGTFYDLWYTINFVPMGDKMYASFPCALNPFENAHELKHVEDNVFRVTKANDYGPYGDFVEFREGLAEVNYAGYLLKHQHGYKKYIQCLKNETVKKRP